VQLVVTAQEVGDGPDQGGEGGVAHGGSILWRRGRGVIPPCSGGGGQVGMWQTAYSLGGGALRGATGSRQPR
jgi:hypothetical protein